MTLNRREHATIEFIKFFVTKQCACCMWVNGGDDEECEKCSHPFNKKTRYYSHTHGKFKEIYLAQIDWVRCKTDLKEIYEGLEFAKMNWKLRSL